MMSDLILLYNGCMSPSNKGSIFNITTESIFCQTGSGFILYNRKVPMSALILICFHFYSKNLHGMVDADIHIL